MVHLLSRPIDKSSNNFLGTRTPKKLIGTFIFNFHDVCLNEEVVLQNNISAGKKILAYYCIYLSKGRKGWDFGHNYTFNTGDFCGSSAPTTCKGFIPTKEAAIAYCALRIYEHVNESAQKINKPATVIEQFLKPLKQFYEQGILLPDLDHYTDHYLAWGNK